MIRLNVIHIVIGLITSVSGGGVASGVFVCSVIHVGIFEVEWSPKLQI